MVVNMRIVIIYARVDKPYCVKIAEILDFHEVWFDQRLYASPTWWKDIQHRLEWCEGAIFVVSSNALDSEYCQRELEIVQSLGKPIFLVMIEPNMVVPEAISQFQRVDLYKGLTADAVHDLLRVIHLAEQHRWRTAPTEPQPAPPPAPADEETIIRFVSQAAQAMEKGDYDKATLLWSQVLTSSHRPRFINVERLAAEAAEALEQQMIRLKVERDYRQIAELIQLPTMRKAGIEAFEAFRKKYPAYDPDNLAALLPRPPKMPAVPLINRANERTRRIPMLEWCEIPGGKVRQGGADGGKRKQVDPFLMARYPVTNKQYQAFIHAPNGYANPQWWDFSPEARQWRNANPEPHLSRFDGHDRPRESITWYEARAFCAWLSELLRLEITLPTLQQRQRAIMADDERVFPWGNTFDQNRCNTRESGLRMTTVVSRYPDGISQYGVYDLAGNVWEWCLEIIPAEKVADEPGTEGEPVDKAVVHGGAFVSPYDRCNAGMFYTLPLTTAFSSIGFRLVCIR